MATNTKQIAPQYTVESYIEHLKQYTDETCKCWQARGMGKQYIDNLQERYTRAVAETANLQGVERIETLARYVQTTDSFCRTPGDIRSTAVRTVKKYCARDVQACFGVEALAEKLCNAVPAEYWYATDMRESGDKTRNAWCSAVFPKTYHRIPELKELRDSARLTAFFSNIKTTPNGISLFGGRECVVDILDSSGNTVYKQCLMATGTLINPNTDTTLRVYMDDSMLLVRTYIADDSSGVKGRRALYITAYSVADDCRYVLAQPIN